MRVVKKSTKNENSTRFFSRKQEEAVANELGFNVVSNSGATKWHKGDVKGKEYLIECKTSMTDKLSFQVKKEWVQKLKSESISMRRPYCALAFNFGPDQENYYIISKQMMREFVEMKAQLEENENETC